MRTAADRATIDRAGQALIDAVGRPARVILFGSHAQSDTDDGSDYRFLVVQPEVADRVASMARLSRILGRLQIPADVVVMSDREVEESASTPGTLAHQAINEGQVIAES